MRFKTFLPTGILMLSFCLALAAQPAKALFAQSDTPNIFGGRDADPGEWPWQVLLVWAGETSLYENGLCGGAVIAPRVVLTAAHCVDSYAARDLDIIIGAHDLRDPEGTERKNVIRIALPPTYDAYDGDSDIALLMLDSVTTAPALDLYRGELEAESAAGSAIVTGWGSTGRRRAGLLQEALLPLISHDTCEALNTYWWFGPIDDAELCAGFTDGGRTACYGDSGGPLMIPADGEPGWAQIGIVSWGFGDCTIGESVSVFARVSAHLSWIDSTMAEWDAQTRPDAFEPDNERAEATPLLLDTPKQAHTLSGNGDLDWFGFDATGGVPYRFEVTSDVEGIEAVIWRYTSESKLPVQVNDGGIGIGLIPWLAWTSAQDETVYLAVESLTSDVGAYSAFITTEASLFFLPALTLRRPGPPTAVIRITESESGNEIPIGADSFATAPSGTPIRFDASAAISGGHPITSYSWYWDSLDRWIPGFAGNSSEPQIDVTFPENGIYRVELTVTDSSGRSGYSHVYIFVAAN